jgi:hypothetical protein
MISQSLLLVLAVFIPSLALAQESNATGSGIYGGGELPAGEWFGVTPYICAEGRMLDAVKRLLVSYHLDGSVIAKR